MRTLGPTKAFIAVVVKRSNSRNCGDTDEEVVAKYRANVHGRLDVDRAASLEGFVWNLEREGSLRELVRQLAEDR